MANFSENNVRHLYVLGSTVSGSATFIDKAITTSVLGDLSIKTGVEGDLFFHHVSPNGDLGNPTIVRSPLINLGKINRCVVKKPAYRNIQTVEIGFNPAVNAGLPVIGQDYILRFVFYNLGIGGQEVQYIKEGGAYRAKTGDSAGKILTELLALAKLNFLREPYPLVDLSLDSSSTPTKLIVKAVEQPWVLGHKQGAPVQFKIEGVPVHDSASGAWLPWSISTDVTSSAIASTSIFNGKTIADMEWFYLGERADHRRGYDYPDNFQTKYLANASLKYDTLDLDFYFSGDKEDVQKSRACVSIASPNEKSVTQGALALGTIALQLVEDLESLGITVIQ